jgi:hypothetical protein
MYSLTQLKQTTSVFLVAFGFACFGLSPAAQAVSPPPDGGYPNFNTAEGDRALFNLTTGSLNTALGFEALFSNADGDRNTAIGVNALHNTTTGGIGNTAIGVNALHNNTTGDDNVAIGTALFLSTTASFNTAIGNDALAVNKTGNFNTANGFRALSRTTGERNTAIGFDALKNNTAGNFNVALGAGAGSGVTTADDVICIGRSVAGVNVSGTCFIGNIRNVTTQNANALPVVIDGAGQLGTDSSSQRFKHDIKPMGKASEALLALEPVTFHYKSDSTNTPQFGLIAEEVAQVNPDLVVRDDNGEIYTVRYEAVNAMLLNEFLKEHETVKEQGATIVHLQNQIEALTAGLQKVSAQLEVSKPAPQTVLNKQ